MKAPLLFLPLTLANLLATPDALASKVAITASGIPGQKSLGVGFDETGKLFAKVCGVRHCSPFEQGKEITLPEASRAHVARAELRLVPLAGGGEVAWVKVPMGQDDRAWNWIATGPARTITKGSSPDAPKVVFSGFSGRDETLGEEVSLTLSEKDARGRRSLILGAGTRALCGRSLILSPKSLDPKSWQFVPKATEVLGSKELSAPLLMSTQPAAANSQKSDLEVAPDLLWGAGPERSAFSAMEANPGTPWLASESAGGPNLAVFRLPKLPVQRLEVARPGSRDVAMPSSFWLLTYEHAFRVQVPGEVRAGGSLQETTKEATPAKPTSEEASSPELVSVQLPEPVTSECLAVVFEPQEAGPPRGLGPVSVTFAGVPPLAELLKKLDETGDPQREAIRVLSTLGSPALSALATKAPELSNQAMQAGMEILDAYPCEESAHGWAKLLMYGSSYIKERATSKLRVCGSRAGAGLARAISETRVPAQTALAIGELALIDAKTAVSVLATRLQGSSAVRAELRSHFARAAREVEAQPVVRRILKEGNSSAAVDLEVLRALGPNLVQYLPEAVFAYQRARTSPGFAPRFLLLEPAGYLEAYEPWARTDLQQAIDQKEDWRLRAQAAASIHNLGRFQPTLIKLLADPEPRVRQAALVTLEGKDAVFAEPAILELLREDNWPMVRAAAARSLGTFAPRLNSSRLLVNALGDSSFVVRAGAATALGRRGSIVGVEQLVQKLGDRDEHLDVRVAAATALGEMCATQAIEPLTQAARVLSDPTAPEHLQHIGKAAINSLVRLSPQNLPARLGLSEKTPSPAWQAALKRAMAAGREPCTPLPLR